jgi:hypothetical protein
VFLKKARKGALRELRSAESKLQSLRRKLGEKAKATLVYNPEFLQESRMRENLTYGSMRGDWKPGMVAGIEAPPERKRESPPGTCSHGA